MKKEAPRNEGLLFFCILTAKDSGASRAFLFNMTVG